MKQRRIAAALTGSLMTVALGAYVAPVAHADGNRPHQEFTPDAQSAAIAHWTPTAMRNAKPVLIDSAKARKSAAGRVQIGTQRVIRSEQSTAAAQATSRTGGAWTKGGKVVKTTGKVFFTIPRHEPGAGDYVCSGSVAPANNKSIIITAGHCVNDANEHQDAGDHKPGKYVTNWVFVPGYNGRRLNPAPYGMYPATRLKAAQSWISHGNFNYDVGFATVSGERRAPDPRDNGKLVQNQQGSQSLGFNLPRHRYVENFGYPQQYPYDGTRLDYSAGPALNADANGPRKGNSTAKDDPNGSNDQVVKSNLTAGASGGPWFYRFNESTGVGTQMSVNSFSYEGLSKKTQAAYKIPKYNMWGPYFGTAIENMFDAVQGPAPRATSKSTTTREDTATKITLSGTKSTAADPTPLSYKITSQPSHGKLTRSGNVVTYTPNKNFNGTDKFTYVANNGIHNSARATVTIKVTPVEDPPRAADVTGRTRADKPVKITLKGTDPDKGDTLTYAVVSGPSDGGTVTINGDVATYTPADGTGATTAQQVTFSYTVSDGHTTSGPATATVTVSPNSAPVGHDDHYSVEAGTTLSVRAPGVLKNDTDADGDPLSAIPVGQLPDGLTFNTDGSFRYDAPIAYTDKTVSFSYRATDGVPDSIGSRTTLSAPRRTTLAYSQDVTVTIAVAAAQRPAPPSSPKPSPSTPPSSTKPSPTQPPASTAPSTQAPNGPLGDTGSPFSPTLIIFGLLTVAAGAGTLVAARLRRS